MTGSPTRRAGSAALGTATCGFSRNAPALVTHRRQSESQGPATREAKPRAPEALMLPSWGVDHCGLQFPSCQTGHLPLGCLLWDRTKALLRPVLTELGQPSSGVRMSGSHSPGGRPEDEGPRFSWTVALPLRPHLLDRDPTPAPAREDCRWAEGSPAGPGWGGRAATGSRSPARLPSCSRDGHVPEPGVAQETEQWMPSLPKRNPSIFSPPCGSQIRSMQMNELFGKIRACT